MLHVTPRAMSELHAMLVSTLERHPESRSEDAGVGFRLVTGGPAGDGGGSVSQLSLTLDSPRAGDEVVEHEGRSVLILDAAMLTLLADLTLDLVETPQGARLGIRESEPR